MSPNEETADAAPINDIGSSDAVTIDSVESTGPTDADTDGSNDCIAMEGSADLIASETTVRNASDFLPVDTAQCQEDLVITPDTSDELVALDKTVAESPIVLALGTSEVSAIEPTVREITAHLDNAVATDPDVVTTGAVLTDVSSIDNKMQIRDMEMDILVDTHASGKPNRSEISDTTSLSALFEKVGSGDEESVLSNDKFVEIYAPQQSLDTITNFRNEISLEGDQHQHMSTDVSLEEDQLHMGTEVSVEEDQQYMSTVEEDQLHMSTDISLEEDQLHMSTDVSLEGDLHHISTEVSLDGDQWPKHSLEDPLHGLEAMDEHMGYEQDLTGDSCVFFEPLDKEGEINAGLFHGVCFQCEMANGE